MCMAVGTFPPSHEFEDYLLNFILLHTYVTCGPAHDRQ